MNHQFSQSTARMYFTPLYVIAPSSGKGLGAFATRNIEVGECILREKPLFLVSRPQDVQQAVEDLSLEDRLDFLSLYDCFHPASPTIATIYQTNWLTCRPFTEADGVCKDLCRINHSCSPNANHVWQPELGVFEVYAQRPFEKGEEITVHYVPLGQPHDFRQQQLRDQWRFDCRCKACTARRIEESDKRRSRLGILVDQMGLLEGLNTYEAIKEFLRLVDQEYESYPLESAKGHILAVKLCATVQDQRMMKKHAAIGYATALLAFGPTNDKTRNLLKSYHTPCSPPIFAEERPAAIDQCCDYCGWKEPRIACDQCSWTTYCDVACYKAHVKSHKTACKLVSRDFAQPFKGGCRMSVPVL